MNRKEDSTCVITCVFLICFVRVGVVGVLFQSWSQVYPGAVLQDRFTCDKAQQMTCWHGHSAPDQQTNHRFKGHFKRGSGRRADGVWKKSRARVFILHLQIIGAWFALPRSPPAPCVKRRAKDLQGDSAAGQLFGFAQLWKSENCLRGSVRAVALDTSALIRCFR